MKIITCLGNPGKQYKKNRHNAGFIIGDYFAGKFGISVKKKAFNAITGTGTVNGTDIILVYPQTFMNSSGAAVKAALQFYKETPDNLIVIHDEIELAFGHVKTKFGGGHKGHNGIRSITEQLATPDFHRVRLGVSRPANSNIPVADYLLSDFTSEELAKLEELSASIINVVLSLI